MRHVATALVLLGLASFAPAAEPSPSATALRDRADRLSRQLEDDASNRLHDFRGALLLARLADAWKKADGRRSRQYLEEAVAIVKSGDKTESDQQLAKRLMVGGTLLEIVSDTDPRLALELASSLAEQAERLPPLIPGFRPSNARQVFGSRLRNLGMKLSEKDPEATAAITEDLIRLHDGSETPISILDVAFRDPARADQLYDKAAAEARASWDYDMVFGLVQLAYPYQPRSDGFPAVSDNIKAEAASLLAGFVLRPMDTPEQRQDVCRASGMAARVLPSLPPDVAPSVAAAVEACKSTPTREAKSFTSLQDASTVDDNLRLAANATDVKSSAHHKLAAARLAAYADHNPGKALEILGSMNDDEREADYQGFRLEWWNTAAAAMNELARSHDLRGMQPIVDGSPDALRGALTLLYAQFLLPSDPELARLKTAEALRILQKYPPDDDRTYPMLLKLYSKAAPEDSLLALRTVVASLNDRDKDEKVQRLAWLGNSFADRMEPLRGAGAILLSLDESTADALLRDLESPNYRAVFRLGLLYAVLDEYDARSHTKQVQPPVKASQASPARTPAAPEPR